MMMSWSLLPLLTLLSGAEGGLEVALQLQPGAGLEAAERVAARHGLESQGEVLPGSGYYLLRAAVGSRRRRALAELARRLEGDPEVDWSEVQAPLVRVKRPALLGREAGTVRRGVDPKWRDMWYLNRRDDLTMNVEGAWGLGVTGLGVTVTVLDDGIEKDHPDLVRNYDPPASTDFNDNDSDPSPRYDPSDYNRHGTRCAGQVAAARNNSLCAVGVAFNANIGGIRMLDGMVSDALEAKSLAFNSGHIDIYSSSWGPNDDGKTVDGPGRIARHALALGIQQGRAGKGSIFVWASGNGGRHHDDCNCDGYSTSIHTVTVSSTSETGAVPWYSEPCSATIATTYSSGSTREGSIVTTDLHHKCTTRHTGTSASAPMAAAIIALALEANPDLTWRDVQHIMIRTSRHGNLQAPDWKMNAVGRMVSHSYGYGLMDAQAMVQLARRWVQVPNQQSCELIFPSNGTVAIQPRGFVTMVLAVSSCPGVELLEHVVSPIHVTAEGRRGDLRIYLWSPGGTRSTLLHNRPRDFSSSGFTDWAFMTTHSWGEAPLGAWQLEIHNDGRSSEAIFSCWSLKLYGTTSDPNSSSGIGISPPSVLPPLS
jgi:furin